VGAILISAEISLMQISQGDSTVSEACIKGLEDFPGEAILGYSSDEASLYRVDLSNLLESCDIKRN
jgi:hypothetical protein